MSGQVWHCGESPLRGDTNRIQDDFLVHRSVRRHIIDMTLVYHSCSDYQRSVGIAPYSENLLREFYPTLKTCHVAALTPGPVPDFMETSFVDHPLSSYIAFIQYSSLTLLSCVHLLHPNITVHYECATTNRMSKFSSPLNTQELRRLDTIQNSSGLHPITSGVIQEVKMRVWDVSGQSGSWIDR